MATAEMNADDQSQIMNYLVRMVVPLRREFGRSLDVGQFFHDLTYAREVIDQALTSQNPRLREYAVYVQQRLHGPRVADSPAAPKASAAPAASAPATAQSQSAADRQAAEEAAMKARMMKKYTDGLR